MKILVCGSRDWDNAGKIASELKNYAYAKPTIIVGALYDKHGNVFPVRGADRMAARAARVLGFPLALMPADFDRLGKRAGPIRNGWMLDLAPSLVLAFATHLTDMGLPGTPGTRSTVTEAIKRGIWTRTYSADSAMRSTAGSISDQPPITDDCPF